jgi:hypothetical protein
VCVSLSRTQTRRRARLTLPSTTADTTRLCVTTLPHWASEKASSAVSSGAFFVMDVIQQRGAQRLSSTV